MAENLGSLNASIHIDGMDKFLKDMDDASHKVSKLQKQLEKPLKISMGSVNVKGIKNAISKPLSEIERKLAEFDNAISHEGKSISNQMVAYSARYKAQTGQDYGTDAFKQAVSAAVNTARTNSSSQASYAGIYDRVVQYLSSIIPSSPRPDSPIPSPQPRSGHSSDNGTSIITNNLDDARRQLEEFYSTQGKLSNVKLDQNTNSLTASLTRANGQVVMLKASLNAAGSIQVTEKTAEGVSKLGKALDDLKGKTLSIAKYFLSTSQIISAVRKGIQAVTDLDDAFTKMRLSSSESTDKLKAFQESSFDIGNAVGVSAIQIQDSAASFLKVGYSLQEAGQLAQNANLYSSISGLGIDEAANYLNTSLKTFGHEFNNDMEASSAIIDRYNKLGHEFSLSSSDIGSAVAVSARDLSDAGNTLNESLGLITAGNELSLDASSIGNAMKVMSQNIRETAGELLKLSNIDVHIDDSTYKSTAQIIKELAEVWNDFAPSRQKSILETLAGEGQTDIIEGLIQNADTMNLAVTEAANATGSALSTNEAALESISGKMILLTNQTHEFWSALMDDGSIKFLVSGFTNILKVITNIIEHVGSIPTILGTIAGYTSIKNFGRVKMWPSNKICRHGSVL